MFVRYGIVSDAPGSRSGRTRGRRRGRQARILDFCSLGPPATSIPVSDAFCPPWGRYPEPPHLSPAQLPAEAAGEAAAEEMKEKMLNIRGRAGPNRRAQPKPIRPTTEAPLKAPDKNEGRPTTRKETGTNG
jgi:hypothetical protein